MVTSFIDTLGNLASSNILYDSNYYYKTDIFDKVYKLNNSQFIYGIEKEKWDSSHTYYSSYLIKFDENFDTIFTKTYFTDTMYSASQQSLEDDYGNYIICGYKWVNNKSWDFLLYSTDSLGNLLWYKNYGGTENEQGYLLKKAFNSGYLIGGLSNSFGNNSPYDNGDWYLVKTDSMGNLQWQRHYGNPSYNDGTMFDMYLTNDSCYLLAGAYTIEKSGSDDIKKSRLVKIDQSGNIIWSNLYGYKGRDNYIKKVFQKNNGDIMILNWIDSMECYCGYVNCMVHCLTRDGQVKWRRKYFFVDDSCSYYSYPYTMKPTRDGGYIFAGIGANVNLTPGQYTWVVKSDSLGFDNVYDFPDTTLGITILTDSVCFNDSAIVFFHLTGKSAPYSLLLDNGNGHDSIFYPYTYETYATDSLYIYPQDSLINQQVIATLTDPFGNIITDTFYVYIRGCGTSINEITEKDSIRIYPNPANDNLTISITSPEARQANGKLRIMDVSILDITGKQVTSKKYKEQSKKYIVNVEDLPAGLYFVKIKTNNGEIIRKFVKR